MTSITGIATSFIDFTRASNATVTDSDGLVKWAPANLLTNSESFDAASWAKSSVTPTANSIAAPNGTTTADTLAASGANGTTLQTFTAEAISYTFGVWLKRKTGSGNIQIAADSGTYTTVTITSDWALYTVTQTPTAGSKTAGIRIVTSADEVYAWGASLYRSDLAMQPNTSAYPMYNPTTPKNLLGFTESFDNAGWAKNNSATASANSTNAPNGLTTADTINANSTSGPYISQIVAANAAPYTFSVYLKRNNCDAVTVEMIRAGVGYFKVLVNLTNGNTSLQDNSTGVTATYSSIDMGGGWYRVALTLIYTDARNLVASIWPTNSASQNAADKVYAWGAQLSDSASLDSYVPVYGAAVTSAAYYGPRRDFDPVTLACKGLLVEEQRTNLLLYSAEFDNGYWTLSNLNAFGSGSVANTTATLDPSGTNTADFIQESTATSAHAIFRNGITLTAVPHTFSVYCKAGTRNWVYIRLAVTTGQGAYFNLSTGVVGTVESGINAAIYPAGNGWYRCSVAITTTAVPWYPSVGIATADNTQSYTGDGTSGIYIWGAQLDSVSGGNASFATSYIPVGATSAGATRNADVASVSTQAFPYSATEGSIVTAFSAMVVSVGTAAYGVVSISDGSGSNRIENYSDTNYTLYVVSGGTPQASIDAGTISVNTVTKIGSAFATNDFAAVINGGTVGTDPSGTLPTVNTMYIGTGSGGLYVLNGHIRQITYLPRRISNADLVTRST